jgi:hypothetical protein
MTFEEKLIRYISSKLIQRRYFLNKGHFPDEKKLKMYIEQVLSQLKKENRQLKYVRLKSENGLITPVIKKVVDQIKIL